MTLLTWEITSVRVTGLSRDKFTMGNIHGYVKNSKETAYDIKLGKTQRFFDFRFLSDFFNMKPPKIAFLNGFLSHCLDERNRGLLRQNFELVCWDRFRNDISPKYVLSLVSNRWMQLNCKIELCTFAKLS